MVLRIIRETTINQMFATSCREGMMRDTKLISKKITKRKEIVMNHIFAKVLDTLGRNQEMQEKEINHCLELITYMY